MSDLIVSGAFRSHSGVVAAIVGERPKTVELKGLVAKR